MNETSGADTPNTDIRGAAYPYDGIVSQLATRHTVQGANAGQPYLVFKFAYDTKAGKTETRTALAFGKAYAAMTGGSQVKPGVSLTEGKHRLYVRFNGASLAVVDFGYPPMTPERRAELDAEKARAEAERIAAPAAAAPTTKRKRAPRRATGPDQAMAA